MPDEKPFDWADLMKQGAGWALAAFLVYWATGKLDSGIENMGHKIDNLSNKVDQGNQYTLRGAWRATEPPTPSELPKGVPAAKDE
jgi:hypothetical protein